MSVRAEYKYYSDDSICRYLAKLFYHKFDIINILYKNNPNNTDTYEQMQKVWDFVFTVEKNEVNKNIFYLYFYECKRQAEIAYLCNVSQAYVSKVLKKIITKLIIQFSDKQLQLPF